MLYKKRYKFLREGFKSQYGKHTWEIGKWYKFDGDLSICHSGFHCSKGIYQAFSYVQGEILAEVEVRGNSEVNSDKEVWREMRVVRAWKWTKEDSVLFAVFAARLVIDIYEKKYPDDDRPRKAIEAAEYYLKHPDRTARAADAAADAAADIARAAYAARAADAADAAAYAARAAYAAADAAGDAAYAAADAAGDAAADAAAYAAADAAAYAAAYAARAAPVDLLKKLDRWMLNHKKTLEEITCK